MQWLTRSADTKSLAWEGILAIRWSDWLEKAPEEQTGDIDLTDRAEGMMLGLANGDSLGNTLESILRSHRLAANGLIGAFLAQSLCRLPPGRTTVR